MAVSMKIIITPLRSNTKVVFVGCANVNATLGSEAGVVLSATDFIILEKTKLKDVSAGSITVSASSSSSAKLASETSTPSKDAGHVDPVRPDHDVSLATLSDHHLIPTSFHHVEDAFTGAVSGVDWIF